MKICRQTFTQNTSWENLQDSEEITIQQCAIDCGKTMQTLLTTLSTIPQLRHLKFVANRFHSFIQDPFDPLLLMLLNKECFPQLEALVFDTESLNTKFAQLLIQVGNSKKLKTLKINNCKINDAVMDTLAQALKQSSFEILSFINNDITDEGATKLFKALSGSPVTKLNISSNAKMSNKSLSCLVTILPTTQLKVFKCQNMELDSTFMQALTGIIEKSPLATLDFSGCDVSEICILSLIERAINSNSLLETIITDISVDLEKILTLPANKKVTQKDETIKINTIPSTQQTDFFKNTSSRILNLYSSICSQNYCTLQ